MTGTRNNKSRRHDTGIARWEVANDNIMIGRHCVAELAAGGSSPSYIYNAKIIKEQVLAFRQAIPDTVRLHYAVKANPHPQIIALLAGLVDGMDVASGGEIDRVLASGFPATDVSFAGPAKAVWELERAVAAGVTLNAESATELNRLRDLSHQGKLPKPKVALRINPDFELRNSGMKMTGRPTAFGIDTAQVDQAFDLLSHGDLDFVGFHIFSGSQNLDADALIEAQSKSIDLAIRLADQAPSAMHKLNIGGGFGVPYFPGDQPLDIGRVGQGLQDTLAARAGELHGVNICIELGRYLVAEAGLYVCRVNDIKTSHNETFVLTNGGMHHHLAASGNFGQVIRKNYPVTLANHVEGRTRQRVNIVGPLCTPLDILGQNIEIATPCIDDQVAVFQSGAYGLTASPQGFLSHPPARELFVSEDGTLIGE